MHTPTMNGQTYQFLVLGHSEFIWWSWKLGGCSVSVIGWTTALHQFVYTTCALWLSPHVHSRDTHVTNENCTRKLQVLFCVYTITWQSAWVAVAYYSHMPPISTTVMAKILLELASIHREQYDYAYWTNMNLLLTTYSAVLLIISIIWVDF